MIKVINGEIKEIGLSKTGTLADGTTVSNYDLLPMETLIQEGWMPLEEIQPVYNPEIELIVGSTFEIQADKVIKTYTVGPRDLTGEDFQENFQKIMESTLKAIKPLIRQDELTGQELLDMKYLFPQWQAGIELELGDLIRYNDILYKVVMAGKHITQADWIPGIGTDAMYDEVQSPGVIPQWVAPTGVHNAYNIGDKVIFEGLVYESLIDGNTWSPTAYPQGWKKI